MLNIHVLTYLMVLLTLLISHPDDAEYSAIKHKFWTQYHKDEGCYHISQKIYLVYPTHNENIYYQRHQLRPYHGLIHLYKEDTVIIGL